MVSPYVVFFYIECSRVCLYDLNLDGHMIKLMLQQFGHLQEVSTNCQILSSVKFVCMFIRIAFAMFYE